MNDQSAGNPDEASAETPEHTVEDIQEIDEHQRLDEVTLGDALWAVCRTLANVIINAYADLVGDSEKQDESAFKFPGLFNLADVEEYIAGQAFNLAVEAHWLPWPNQPAAAHGITLGSYRVEEPYRQRFMGMLGDLRKLLETTLAARAFSDAVVPEVKPPVGGRAKGIIKEYFRLSPHCKSQKQLAQKASPIREKLDYQAVSEVDISRIVHGHPVTEAVREAVAQVLNEEVPCTKDDLLPADWTDKHRK